MSQLQTIVLALTVLSLLGCSKGSPEQPAGAEPIPQPPITAEPGITVDECGRYQVDFADSKPCTTDGDCAWTAHRPGTCVDPLCKSHYRAGTKDWVKEADTLYERACEGKKWKHCTRVKCIHKKPTGASCVDGKCTLQF